MRSGGKVFEGRRDAERPERARRVSCIALLEKNIGGGGSRGRSTRRKRPYKGEQRKSPEMDAMLQEGCNSTAVSPVMLLRVGEDSGWRQWLPAPLVGR